MLFAAGNRRRSETRPASGLTVRQGLPILVGAAALVWLVLAVRPRVLGGALARFNPLVVPLVVLLSVSWYVLQGLRWHFLLRDAGAGLRWSQSLLLSMAGQVVTAILPLGDLTRAMFASQAGGIQLGTAAATVTVQELTFTLLLVLIGIPGTLAFHVGTGALAAMAAGMAAIFGVLTVPPLFRAVHEGVSRLPLVRVIGHQLRALREQTVRLLHRRTTVGWASLDLARAAVGVSVLWCIVQGLDPGAIDWWQAALVAAVAYVGGAVSFLPGGTGASDATVVGLLVVLGVHPGTALATDLLQRCAMTGIPTILGAACYLIARRRFDLTGLLTRRPA